MLEPIQIKVTLEQALLLGLCEAVNHLKDSKPPCYEKLKELVDVAISTVPYPEGLKNRNGDVPLSLVIMPTVPKLEEAMN